MSRVWINGGFDVLHLGHIRLLHHASTLGELTVGINSDSSIRALKGPRRPIWPQEERSETLSAIRGVHQVVIFDEPDPVSAIGRNGPFDFIVKGPDYAGRDFPEKHLGIMVIYSDTGITRHASDLVGSPCSCSHDAGCAWKVGRQ